MTLSGPIGLLGLGAFGQLAAGQLAPHCTLLGHDPNVAHIAGGRLAPLAEVAAQPIVVLAVPVQDIATACEQIRPYLCADALVVDVASVKLETMHAMRRVLGPQVRLAGTHPLFGPGSLGSGLAGQAIVLCPEAGEDVSDIAAALHGLGLKVHVTDADTHDRIMAQTQALTHLVARLIRDLDLPEAPFSTPSHTLLRQAVNMVSGDSDALFRAIERRNPHAAKLRKRFIDAARALDERLDD